MFRLIVACSTAAFLVVGASATRVEAGSHGRTIAVIIFMRCISRRSDPISGVLASAPVRVF